MVENWTKSMLREQLTTRNGLGPEAIDQQWMTILDKTLTRGDSFLVYENRDLGHPDVGVLWGCSYGSEAAQITDDQFPEPPERCPDIVGWPPMFRFWLTAMVTP